MPMSPERRASAYLDAPCTRRQTLTAIEQLIAMHEERHHTGATARLWGRLLRAARHLKVRVSQARRQ